MFDSAINSKLTVLQWNCRSLTKNLEYLIHYLSENSVDIVCVQQLKKRDLPRLDGFYFPPVSGTRAGTEKAGTVTYLRIGIQYTEADRVLGVSVQLENKTINIFNLYYPAGDREGEWIKFHGDPNCLVVGDFNEHSAMWEDGYTKTESRTSPKILDSDFNLVTLGM